MPAVPDKAPPKGRKRRSDGDTPEEELRVFQINICGLSRREQELAHVLNSNKVDIALLQETRIFGRSDDGGTVTARGQCDQIPGYKLYLCSCADHPSPHAVKACQGLGLLINTSSWLRISEIKTQTSRGGAHTQSLTVTKGRSVYRVANVICSQKAKLKINVNSLWSSPEGIRLVDGDFNLRCSWLGYEGKEDHIAESFMSKNSLACVQDVHSEPTFLCRTSAARTRPDLTFVDERLRGNVRCKVLGSVGSDHLPTLITLRSGKLPPR